MDREELFKSWTKLSLGARSLTETVQNPIEYITIEDSIKWFSRVIKLNNDLDRLSRETISFISENVMSVHADQRIEGGK